MSDQSELILVFISVIIGVISASYFYISAGIFANLNFLKMPLKLISSGMFVIAIGVLLAAFISYEAKAGIILLLYGIPLQVLFYVLYIIGSLLILFGARKLTNRSKRGVVDVSLQSE